MQLDFCPITLEGRAEYRRLLAQCPQVASDYSFVNLFGWREHYGLEWAFSHGLAWIRQTKPANMFWAPVGPWWTFDWAAHAGCMAGQHIIRVPETLTEHWIKTLRDALPPRLSEARGMWDYLYRVGDMVALEGPRYAKKKKLLDEFRLAHPAEYSPLTADCVEEVLEMQFEWCQWRDCEDSPSLVAENEAIAQVLENWDALPELLGGGIRVGGRLVAYTVAEALTDDTLLIHFEKAHTSYNGAYQAINQMFLEHNQSSRAWVNREQDMDEDGLRKAKLSYNPSDFLRKFEVRFGQPTA